MNPIFVFVSVGVDLAKNIKCSVNPLSYVNTLSNNIVVTHIINSSFIEGIFPKKLKLARVVPIYKSGDSTLLTNYRPISILTCF